MPYRALTHGRVNSFKDLKGIGLDLIFPFFNRTEVEYPPGTRIMTPFITA